MESCLGANRVIEEKWGVGGVKVEHSCLYPADVPGPVFTVHLAVRLGGGKEE